MRLVPTFFFVDLRGYKGLSLRLINSVLRPWGCDCIFFLNYNRVNMGINNDFVQMHMEALFGKERASALRVRLDPLTPEQRELAVVDAVSAALKEMGGNYPLPFCFQNEDGTRTSHYLKFSLKTLQVIV
jgi:three-Cys-motif partner protein